MARPRTNAVGVDNTFRRKWDCEEFLQRTRERERQEDEESKFKSKEKAPPVQRKPLKHRNYEVDLESCLGKTQVVTPIASLSQQVSNEVNIQSMNLYFAGWILLFSLSESSRHVYEGGEGNSSTGILCSVQERFEMLKKQKAPESFSEQDLDERLRKQQEEEEERLGRERKKEKKKEKAAKEETEDVDPDVAAMMGFGGFRSLKK
ncbi:unnamed protein product [Musa acuminata subsp. burmannicoides]